MRLSSDLPSRYSILVVQEYVPSYRLSFFEELQQQLEMRGASLVVCTTNVTSALQSRNDRVTLSAEDSYTQYRIGIRSRALYFRNLLPVMRRVRPDVIVFEQSIRFLDTYIWILLSKIRLKPKIAFWGHGLTLTKQHSSASRRLKRSLTNKADWFFAYTQGSADVVADSGFCKERISVVRNSTDTLTLRASVGNLTKDQIHEFRLKFGIIDGPVALYLGRLDPEKGVAMLLDAAKMIRKRLPDFQLLIGGTGALTNQVAAQAKQHGWIHYLGRIDGETIALAGSLSDVVLQPDWVGLVAVDALAMGLPLITMESSNHAPEFGYLEQGKSCLISSRNLEAYVETTYQLLTDPDRLTSMKQLSYAEGSSFSTQNMAEKFADGLLKMRTS